MQCACAWRSGKEPLSCKSRALARACPQAPTTARLQRENTHDQIDERIDVDIPEHRLHPGTTRVEECLDEIFGVSRANCRHWPV